MATERECELEAEVRRLHTEVARLQAELTDLRDRRSGQTREANAARTRSAAQMDDMVVKAIVAHLRRRHHIRTTDLEQLGYPHFAQWYSIRTDVAAVLNAKGIPAPRGGAWSAKQISRALQRHAARSSAKRDPGSN